VINLRSFVNLTVIFFGLVFGIKFYFLCNGDVLNYYPLISPDGFDWYTEGAYLYKSFATENLPSLTVLRPPLFVLTTLVDFLIGGGLFLAFIYSISIVFTYFFILWIIELCLGNKQEKAWFLIPLAIATTIYPVNFIKGYLLSDGLAVCLSLFAVYMLAKYFERNKRHLLIFSSLIAILGGLTQTYALLPYLTFLSLRVFSKQEELGNRIFLILNALFVLITFFFISYLWRIFLKHESTPQYFDLLKLSFGMFDFYINTWGYYFAPFLLLVITNFRSLKFNKYQSLGMSSLTVTLALGFLCFIYQWPESRFTYFLWPWVIISFFSLISPICFKAATKQLTATMLIISFMAPSNYWQPSLKSLSFKYQDNWVVNYFRLIAIDRKLTSCDTLECKGNLFLGNSDPYVNAVIKLNLFLRGVDPVFGKN
jgi:hypothetical protein